MSRCIICDVFIEEPKISALDLKPEPCSTCQRVIQETLETFNDPEDDCYAYIDDEGGDFVAQSFSWNEEDG